MSILSLDKSFTPIQQDMKLKPLPEEKESIPDAKKENVSSLAQQEAGDDLEKKLEEAIGQINNTIGAYRTELKFAIHKESGQVSVKVIDKRDNSVIREIPSERALKFAAHVKKLLGVIFDEFI
ncbi:flagellar protein FlaG [Pelotomaculum propionicicum]|uniref:flagellar protein FlaG n=1 Tax=Pelotomaculum propionicicum TaxID=258475 RepID=UPI003B762B40